MNIRDIIDSCTLKKPPTFVDNIEPLLAGIETANLEKIAVHLKKHPEHFNLRQTQIRSAFFKYFTAELGLLFFKKLSFEDIEKQVNTGGDIPSSFWMWLAEQKYTGVVRDTFQWSVEMLTSADKMGSEKTYAHQFRHACLQKIPNAQTWFLETILSYLNSGCVFQWSSEDWGALQSITSNQFLQCLVNGHDPEVMLDINDSVDLLALRTSFDNLPNLEQAFNIFFAQNNKDYQLLCVQLSSPDGLEKSKGFQKLSTATQKDLLNDIKHDFDQDNNGSAVLAGEYKHLLGYTPCELFLKRFNDPNDDLMARIHLVHNTAMSNLFGNQAALSPLHALVTHSPKLLLAMDKTMGQKIAQCFNDGRVLTGFFNSVEPEDYRKILKRFPILVDWRDEKGNSLGHWSAVFHNIVGDFFEAAINNPQLLEHNHIGCSIRDIIQNDINCERSHNTNEVAQLDHIILTRAMGSTTPRISSKRKL